jgi:hypothetical protein
LSASEIYSTSLPFFFEGGKASGLGGAFVAVADDSEAVFYNPAGLAQIKKNNNISFQTSFQNYRFDYRYFGYTDIENRVKSGGCMNILRDEYCMDEYYSSYIYKNLGISLLYRSILEKSHFTYFEPFLEETTFISSIFTDLNNLFEEIPHSLFYCGVNIKLHYSHIYPVYRIDRFGKCYLTDRYQSVFVTADAGILYNFRRFFSIGLTVRNILSRNILSTVFSTSDFNTSDTSNTFIVIDDIFVVFDPLLIREALPPNVDIGVKMTCKFGLLSFDIRNLIENAVNGRSMEGIKYRGEMLFEKNIFNRDYYSREYIFKRSYHLGLELTILNPFIIRCGVFCQPRSWQEDESLLETRFPLGQIEDPGFEEVKNRIKTRYIKGFSINVGYKYKDRFEFNVTLENETGDTGTETSPVYDIFYMYNVQGIIKRGIISKYIISCRYLF